MTALLAAVAGVAAPAASAQAPYQIPPDNPFVGRPGARAEVYAYGLRNPYRWSFDRLTGDMYIGDVGANQREEVTFLPRASSAGANLGWNCHEGDVPGPGNCTAPGHRPPQHTYPETGQPVVGGYVVRDPTLGAFQGRYLFGRYTGIIRSLGSGATGPPAETGLSVPQLTSFGEDGVGRVYVTSQAGPVHRLTASGGTLGASLVGNFVQPAALAAPPGDPDRLFVAELGGHVRLRAGGQVHDFLNIDALVETGGERGLLAVAVAPDYAASGRVFVYYTANGGDLTLDEFRRSASDPNRADPATRRNLLTIEHSAAGNHNGGQLQFGRDGYLYLSTGDGGGQGDPERDAQTLGSLLGKILRIGVNPTVGPPPAPLPAPIATDNRRPRLLVRMPRRQRVLRLRGAVAYAGCDEACTIRAGAVLRVGKRRLRMISVRRPARAAQAGKRVRLKVRLKRRQARILRRALRRGRRPVVRVGLRATDPAGNRSTLARRTVRVRPR
ncbi:MAG TPA: PQQ-dependent sugar dehydrogenase [Thermoleophilaceae bacterium]|nr:PQQ-dependent sugar dehydrogenase [Thermoleophilaceae bacterium]